LLRKDASHECSVVQKGLGWRGEIFLSLKLLGCFMRVFVILIWFNPIAWILVSSWVAACEHEADLAAVSDEGPLSYANELLSFARAQSLHDSAGSHDLRVPAFTRSKLADRIELLLVKGCCRRQDHWIGGLSITALILSLIGCAWLGRPVTFSDQMHEEAVTRLSANAFP
jgi:beta-lactamase regulating signal transducer with metallopeptidase domain